MRPEDVPAELVELAARAIWEHDTPAPELGWPHWDVAVERAANGLWDLPKMVADTRDIARHALAAVLPLYGAEVRAQDAKTVEAMRPETGMHINTSEYRQGKYDALTLAAARLRDADPEEPT